MRTHFPRSAGAREHLAADDDAAFFAASDSSGAAAAHHCISHLERTLGPLAAILQSGLASSIIFSCEV